MGADGGHLSPNRYTLCLGAGISRDISPDWQSLAQELMSQAFNTVVPDAVFNELLKLGWSLDDLIQAASNQFKRIGKSKQDFGDAIEQCLYGKIRSKSRGMGLEKYLISVLNRPKSEPKDRIIEVCNFLEESFPKCSLFSIGRFLVESAQSGHAPYAVLSFNADAFLETYIDLYLRREHYLSPPPHAHPRYYFTTVNGSGGRRGSKIPIYHCHGSIAPLERIGKSTVDRRDRLVFLEQEYLALSSGQSAWAQTMFLYHAQTTKMAFCGLSMSDTNIRRWMSSLESDTEAYHNAKHNDARANPEHIWLRPKPEDPLTQEIMLVSLMHLGVRPAWIDGWEELYSCLSNLSSMR